MTTISIILSILALINSIAALTIALICARKVQDFGKTSVYEVDEKAWQKLKELTKKVESIENGIVPDYEQARAAADAVNDFNRGITAILGYDPADALKKSRSEEGAIE